MNKQQEALKLALEALRDIVEGSRLDTVGNRNDDGLLDHDNRHDFTKRVKAAQYVIAFGKETLAQPAQEPDWKDQYEKQKLRAEMWIAKYEKDIGPLEKAAPVAQPAQEPVAWEQFYPDMGKPQRPWVGLTDEDRKKCVNTPFVAEQWANIEAKLKELNT